ncbi:DeoR/GlpR family DNA-binding transcription regulator [Labrys okinawensis]|uniref:DeoR/GlpR family DNA-binding transcription regulator n=1 Tax=Labrys okinawensis TaxID=346911 RepID=UPI0039BD5C71
MLAENRRQQIMLEVQRTGQVRTTDMANLFQVSEVTIRSDLLELERLGQITRIHGGALALNTDSPVAAFDKRMRLNFEAKQRIARFAARFIVNDQSIVMDGGSTLLQLALHVPPMTNLVVATPALNIAQQLMLRPGIDVHMIGGRVNVATVSTIGSDIEQGVDGFRAHQAFVSAQAIDRALDIVDSSHDVARTKRNLVRLARRVVLLADSSKWDQDASSKAFSMSKVKIVVTDDKLSRDVRHRLEDYDLEVYCV